MRRKKLGLPSWSAEEGFRRLFKKHNIMKSTKTTIPKPKQQVNQSNYQSVISRIHQPNKQLNEIQNTDQLQTYIKRKSTLETKRAAKSVQINFDSISVKSQRHGEDHNLSRLDESDKENQNRTQSDKLVKPVVSYSNFQDNLSNLFIKSGSEQLILSDILAKLNVELDEIDGHLKTLEAQNRIMIAVDDGTKKVFLI